jgi:hypothetical protein
MKPHIVEFDKMYEGLRCVGVFHNFGHRCGYVGIDKTHPLFGMDYDDSVPKEFTEYWKQVSKSPIGKRKITGIFCCDVENPRVRILFDVHGSITYSGSGESGYPVKSDLWFFGFDCAHYNKDGTDILSHKNYFPNESSLLFCNSGTIRTQKYVEDECESLARQLNTFIEQNNWK